MTCLLFFTVPVVDDLAIVVSGRTCCAYDGGRHDASVNDREESKMTSKPARFRIVTLTMEGWTEEPLTDEMRVWRTSRGDVLSLTTIDESLELPSLSDVSALQGWCRALAESREAGLIEVRVDAGRLGTTVGLIYKRLEMPAYIFTAMLVVPRDEGADVWTVVSGEYGLTGVREAIVTTQLMSEGKLTVEDYQRSWAQDLYDPTYSGVD